MVGLQDKRKLGGHEKSRKQRKAEQLIRQGTDIQILSEADFCELANIAMPAASAVEQKAEAASAGRGRALEVTIELSPETEQILRQLRKGADPQSGG